MLAVERFSVICYELRCDQAPRRMCGCDVPLRPSDAVGILALQPNYLSVPVLIGYTTACAIVDC